MIRGLLLCALLGVCLTANADPVYRYVAPDGSVHFTDKPPNKRARPLDLGTPSGTTPAPRGQTRYFASEAALRAAARFAVSVESPTPEQTLHSGDSAVLAASVMPGLVAGYHLRYLLDGHALTAKPVADLSLLLPADTPSGPHTVVIAVLNPEGQEVARSAPTKFTLIAP